MEGTAGCVHGMQGGMGLSEVVLSAFDVRSPTLQHLLPSAPPSPNRRGYSLEHSFAISLTGYHSINSYLLHSFNIRCYTITARHEIHGSLPVA